MSWRDLAHRAGRGDVGFAGRAGGDQGEKEGRHHREQPHPPSDLEEQHPEDDACCTRHQGAPKKPLLRCLDVAERIFFFSAATGDQVAEVAECPHDRAPTPKEPSEAGCYEQTHARPERPLLAKHVGIHPTVVEHVGPTTQ